MDETLRNDPQTFAVIGAAMQVHSVMGRGFLESVYADAMAVELRERGIDYSRERSIRVEYRGHVLPSCFRADFICQESLLLELKAVDRLIQAHTAQVLHYMRASGINKALLLNFGGDRLQYKRYVN
jgi:GxxExxY protein